MTDDDFRIASLFDTPAKRMSAAIDFAGGLIASALLVVLAWVMS